MTSHLWRALSRVAALVLFGLAVLLVNVLVIRPVTDRIAAAQERIEDLRVLQGRLDAATQSTAEGPGKDLQSVGASSVFLAGNSDGTSSAGLQSLIAEIATAEGAKVLSTRAMDPVVRDSLRILGVEAQLSATIEQLQRILYKYESSEPYLFVGSLQAIPAVMFTGESGSPARTLEVRVEVMGVVEQKRE